MKNKILEKISDAYDREIIAEMQNLLLDNLTFDEKVSRLRALLFDEETAWMYDDGWDMGLRERGINPMSDKYIKKVQERREKLGISSLSESGDSTDDSSKRFCEEIVNLPSLSTQLFLSTQLTAMDASLQKLIFNQSKLIIEKHNEFDRISGRNFNLFEILNITTDETRLHSKFIAELLNPLGSHGQGNLYFRLFLEVLNNTQRCTAPLNFDVESYSVEVEKHIETEEKGGRIDIYLKDSKDQIIVIENKIYAHDQEKQLVRYSSINPQCMLYLTLDGHEPSEHSRGELNSGVDFHTISYEKHISDWLQRCKEKSADLPLIREGIAHYFNLIDNLTNNANSNKMIEDLTKLVSKTPENFKATKDIVKAYEESKIQVQKKFWQALHERKEFNWEEPEICDANIRKYYEYSRSNKLYGYQALVLECECFKIYARIEIDRTIYLGFKTDEGNEDVLNSEEYSNIQRTLKDLDSGYEIEKWWLGWRHPKTYIDFVNMNDAASFLFDEAKKDAIVLSIVSELKDDAEKLKKSLNRS
jgi:hypothetical protein